MSGGRWMSGLVLLGGLAASVLLFRARDSIADGASCDFADPRIAKGFAITPVPLDLQGKDRALVGLGSYVVNAETACNDCHSNPSYAAGHDPFAGGDGQFNAAGYLRGGKDFGNGVVAPALTPDAQGLPGGLTLEQFARAMSTGDDPVRPGHILQVMPWPVYRHMVDRDQRAVYEYLRAIPPAITSP